jgi:hypothetical protein
MKTETLQALIKVQSTIGSLTKGESNPFFKSKYVPLPDILNEIKPILNENGFFLLQEPLIDDQGREVLKTRLIHTSGDEISCVAPLKIEEKERNNPQKYGSAITYMRRYSLTSLLGIAEEDDDGNSASTPGPQKKEYKNKSGLSSNGDLASGEDMKQTLREANEKSFRQLKVFLENCRSKMEIEQFSEKNKPAINKLGKHAPDLLEVLKEAKELLLQDLPEIQ